MLKRPGELSHSIGQTTVPKLIESLNPEALSPEPIVIKKLEPLEFKPTKTVVILEVAEESVKSLTSIWDKEPKIKSTGSERGPEKYLNMERHRPEPTILNILGGR